MFYSRNDKPRPWPFLIAAILILLLIDFIRSCESSINYNDGICSCGGYYIYQQAIGHQYWTDYLYICDKCGRAIEISEYYSENNEN